MEGSDLEGLLTPRMKLSHAHATHTKRQTENAETKCLKNILVWGWRDGSSRGPRLNDQHPHGSSQQFVTSVLEDQMPSSSLIGTQTYM